jgi:integrase
MARACSTAETMAISTESKNGLSEGGSVIQPPRLTGKKESLVPPQIDVLYRVSPPVGLEDTVPGRERWWDKNAKEYAAWGREEKGWSDTVVENTVRCLRAWPARFLAAGLSKPTYAKDVTADMVLRWKRDPWGPGHYSREPRSLKQTTASQALSVLRGFIRRTGDAGLAAKDAIWRVPRGDATNRRWFDGPTLDRLYEACLAPRERLAVVLPGWAGLRRREVCLLRVGDVRLALDSPSMVVTRKGGRRQELPLSAGLAAELQPFVLGRAAAEFVYPSSYNVIDRDLRRLGVRLGIPQIAAHDLRRTFGRILYYEKGVDINRIRILYNHRDTAQTLYYIGATQDDLRAAVRTFDERPGPLRQAVPVGA